VLKGEAADFVGMAHSGTWDWSTFAWGNFVTGVFGFLISVAGILSVKVTSPVTHMFSSAARSVLQVALGVKIFGDVLTTQRALSVLTILSGTLLYTWAKSRETPPPDSKELILPMTNLPNAALTRKLLDAKGQRPSEEQLSDSEEIFATGAHDSDEEVNVHIRKPS